MKTDMRRQLARQPFEEKIRKVGELIRLRQKIKTNVFNGEHERANGRDRVDKQQACPEGEL